MLTLIENGELFAPRPMGVNSILLSGNIILKIGKINRRAVEDLHVGLDVIDASDCVVIPGFVDPHQHLLGGSGEEGFATQTPEIYASEIVSAGITTVVGCLGVDTTMKTMPGLLAKAKALKEEGLNAYVWSGGYNVPPTTITDSVKNDIMFIEEIIGAGEVAIADERSTTPELQELSKLVRDAHNGGMLSQKAGVTHFHVGEGEERLSGLRALIDEYNIPAEWLYPTHVERSEELMIEAIELAKRGAFIDIDVVEEDLAKWLKFYLSNNGAPDKLTISTDTSKTSPANLYSQFRECILEHKFTLEQILPMFTLNTATILKLDLKGRLEENKAADVLVLKKEDLVLKEVISLGRRLLKNGKLNFKEKFAADSNRQIKLEGEKKQN